MGKVLRGQGTTQEWTVASELSRARWDSYYTVKHDNHNMMTKEQREEANKLRAALPKAVLINALTRRASLRHAGTDLADRVAFVKHRSWGMGLRVGKDNSAGHRSIHGFMQSLERWLHNWPTLIHLAKTNPDGARIFTRRQSPHMDSHVGVHVGGAGGMPKNAYSSITILPPMADADLSYFRQLHAKLKPLTDLLSQTQWAGQQAAQHQRNIEDLKRYAIRVAQLDEKRDEWLRQDGEVAKWLDSRPDCIKDGQLNIRINSASLRDSTLYQLLGRRPWDSEYKHTKQLQDSAMARVEAYSPSVSAEMIDREAVKKAITEIMEEAVQWACTYEADFTTDGGEEE